MSFKKHLKILLLRKESKFNIVPPKEIVLSFSNGTFLTNYDITDRNLYYMLIYSIVQKWTIWEQNNSMETTYGFRSSGWEAPNCLCGINSLQ